MVNRWHLLYGHTLGYGALGQWYFAFRYGMTNPYARTIKPRVLAMKPGLCAVQMKQRWRVQNHIGTIHALAVCNLMDMSAKLVADATLHRKYVFNPVGMDVNYKKKCTGKLTAKATLDFDETFRFPELPCEITVPVEVYDLKNEVVSDAKVVTCLQDLNVLLWC